MPGDDPSAGAGRIRSAASAAPLTAHATALSRSAFPAFVLQGGGSHGARRRPAADRSVRRVEGPARALAGTAASFGLGYLDARLQRGERDGGPTTTRPSEASCSTSMARPPSHRCTACTRDARSGCRPAPGRRGRAPACACAVAPTALVAARSSGESTLGPRRAGDLRNNADHKEDRCRSS